jgi:prevent-host-death family protein
MPEKRRAIALADLGRNTAGVLDELRRTDEPVIIIDDGDPAAVMLSVEAFERDARERQLLLLLVRGEEEIAAGVGHEIDNVMADADALLDTTP